MLCFKLVTVSYFIYLSWKLTVSQNHDDTSISIDDTCIDYYINLFQKILKCYSHL